MKSALLLLAVSTLLVVPSQSFTQQPRSGDEPALQTERENLSKRLAEIDAELARLKEMAELRYVLPVQDNKKTSAARWQQAAPVVDGFSDPNQIVYDQA